jgi:hypothetical protein
VRRALLNRAVPRLKYTKIVQYDAVTSVADAIDTALRKYEQESALPHGNENYQLFCPFGRTQSQQYCGLWLCGHRTLSSYNLAETVIPLFIVRVRADANQCANPLIMGNVDDIASITAKIAEDANLVSWSGLLSNFDIVKQRKRVCARARARC